MSNFRKTVISNCEKEFLLKNLTKWTRLDGRAFEEFRDIKIEFGSDWGCCHVSLGKTKTLAQVSCELQYPNASRPNEGILYINLELNPMADPNYEVGRQSDLSAQLNRLLEKCIKDSKAVDLESLCVKLNERVWAFRVDINVLNHEGNILDCASIAALAALAHFRRPDISWDGEEFKIYSHKQRDPIPTVLHHYPVCVSFGIYKEGEFILADPNLLEEGVADAFLSVALNSYKELCGLHLGGKTQLAPEVILETTHKAAKRASHLVELIKEAVEKDIEKRQAMQSVGFHTIEVKQADISLADLSVCLDQWSSPKKQKKGKKSKKENLQIEAKDNQSAKEQITQLGASTAELVFKDKPNSSWEVIESDDGSEEDIVCIGTPNVETIDLANAESEEEDVVILNAESKPKKKKRRKQIA
ncbi:exosome complex component RRP45 [Cylas formicarius]|uniref:exosome complex component RRP45 n=1 Tax=Cylas formicarius TaxID=197179 RepID=UPI002958C00C|nr:exosome complex component RRP45 [Cylas formicarius]